MIKLFQVYEWLISLPLSSKFPLLLASLQTVRHTVLLGLAYLEWANSSRYDLWASVQNDLSYSFSEPYSFCGAWTIVPIAQQFNFGMDAPAYSIGVLLHEILSGSSSCSDFLLLTPRGQIISVALAFVLWLLVGLGIRSMTCRRWHRRLRALLPRTMKLVVVVLGAIVVVLGVSIVMAAVAGGLHDFARLLSVAVWPLLLLLVTLDGFRAPSSLICFLGIRPVVCGPCEVPREAIRVEHIASRNPS